jgi:2'-5' RNA ligase
MKRIFIAVKIEEDENFIRIVSSLRSALSDEQIKWTRTGNNHITLAFLGDTEEKMIAPLDNMLKEKCSGTGEFDIVLKGLGVFKNLRDPRIIWTGIKNPENLMKLNSSIISGLNETGIKTEERPFSPHLTLGRIRRIDDKTALRSLLENHRETLVLKQTIDKVILYESILSQAGSIYNPLAGYKL